MEKFKVMVTGGAGFIGSHVCEALHNAGHQVIAIDSMERGKRENLAENIELIEQDIRDKLGVEKIFGDYKPDIVVHHAAQVSVRDSVEDPKFDADVNIAGSLTLLEACRRFGVKRFIFASTGGAIYGEQDTFPAPETHPERPLSPYGVAKLSVEKYLHYYQTVHGISWAALRYSNVYGPRQDPHGEAGVVAIFCQKMLSGDTPLINGDGEQTRDYVYVGDVARANLSAVDSGIRGPINVATGVETTVNEIFRKLRDLSGKDVEEKHGEAKQGEQRRSVLDTTRAKEELGWEPEMELKDGLEKTMQFFRGEG